MLGRSANLRRDFSASRYEPIPDKQRSPPAHTLVIGTWSLVIACSYACIVTIFSRGHFLFTNHYLQVTPKKGGSATPPRS
jgi:hypothetical protein